MNLSPLGLHLLIGIGCAASVGLPIRDSGIKSVNVNPSRRGLTQFFFGPSEALLDKSIMDTLTRLMEITSRLEHLETAAEFIARETVHVDNALSQTGTLITVLADDVREKIYALVQDLERTSEVEKFH